MAGSADNTPSAWERDRVAHFRGYAVTASRNMLRGKLWNLTTDDLAQTALLAVVRACRRYAGESADCPPDALLKAAIRNALIDVARREMAEARSAVTVPLDAFPVDSLCAMRERWGPSPLHRAAARQALSRIDAEDSRSGYSYPEIAAALAAGDKPADIAKRLGLKLTTARQLVFRVRHFYARHNESD